MTYVFYVMIVLSGIFVIVEIVNILKGRDWGENP